MRTLATTSLVVATFALLVGGCRCSSDLPEPLPSPTVDVPVTPSPPVANGPKVWCMACAKAGFTACKRVEGRDGEKSVRRRAEIAACKDVGIAEADCSGDKLSNVKCGEMP